LAGNLLTGWWMNRLPSHHLFAASAFISAINLAVLPHVSGLMAMTICTALLTQGAGVGDCSYGALVWVARECGVTNDGAYMAVKNLGTCTGFVLVMAISLASSTRQNPQAVADYSMLAYLWSGICATVGIVILAIPSPTAPKEALAARETPGHPRAIARREMAINLAGGLLSAVVVGIFTTALTLPANWIGATEARRLVLFMACMTTLGQILMAPLMDRLPAAVAHIILLTSSALGCLLSGLAFVGGNVQGPRLALLWTGYGLLGTSLLANLGTIFTFMSSLVHLSGTGSSIIGAGAAINPFFAAGAAAFGRPELLWMCCSALLIAMAAMVLMLQIVGPKMLQQKRV